MSEKTKRTSLIGVYLSLFLLGLSSMLINSMIDLESFIFLRLLGKTIYDAQGMCFFLRRFNLMIGIVVTALGIVFCGPVICGYWHWFLFFGYLFMSVYISLISSSAVTISKLTVTGIFSLSVISYTLQTSSVKFMFDPKVFDGQDCSLHILIFLAGCFSSGILVRILLQFSDGNPSLTLHNSRSALRLFTRVFWTFTLISGMSALLLLRMTSVKNGESESMKDPSLYALLNTHNRWIFVVACLGWCFSPMLNNFAISLVHTLDRMQSLDLEYLQYLVSLLVSLVICMLVYNGVIVFKGKTVIYNSLGPALCNIVNPNNIMDSLQGNEISEEARSMASSINSRLVRSIQPWVSLPHGYWTEWEEYDNTDHHRMVTLVSIHMTISKIRNEDTYDGYDDCEASKSIYDYYMDLLDCKYSLLWLICCFVNYYQNLFTTLDDRFPDSCSTQDNCCLKNIRGALISHKCCCISERDKPDIKYDCQTCSDKNNKYLKCYVSSTIKTCIRDANKLLLDVNSCGELGDDFEVTSETILLSATAIERFLLTFLSLLLYIRLVDEFLLLHSSVRSIAKKTCESFSEYIKKCKCGEHTKTEEGKGCKCCCTLYYKFLRCCCMLHNRHNDVVNIILGKSTYNLTNTIPTLSLTRSVLLLSSYFPEFLDSKFTCEPADCTCKHAKDSECPCKKYSTKLDDVLNLMIGGLEFFADCDGLLSSVILLYSTLSFNDTSSFALFNHIAKFSDEALSSTLYASKIFSYMAYADFLCNGTLNISTAVTTSPKVTSTCNCICCKDLSPGSCCCFKNDSACCENNANNIENGLIKVKGLFNNTATLPTITPCNQLICALFKLKSEFCNMHKVTENAYSSLCESAIEKLCSSIEGLKILCTQCGSTNGACNCSKGKASSCKINKRFCNFAKFLVAGNHNCTENCTCKYIGCALRRINKTLNDLSFEISNCVCHKESTVNCGLCFDNTDCNCISGNKGINRLFCLLCCGISTLNSTSACIEGHICKIIEYLVTIKKLLESLSREYKQLTCYITKLRCIVRKEIPLIDTKVVSLRRMKKENFQSYDKIIKSSSSTICSVCTLYEQHCRDFSTLRANVCTHLCEYNKLRDVAIKLENKTAHTMKLFGGIRYSLFVNPIKIVQNIAADNYAKKPQEAEKRLQRWRITAFLYLIFTILLFCKIGGLVPYVRNIPHVPKLRFLVAIFSAVTSFILNYSFVSLATFRCSSGYLINMAMLFGLASGIIYSWISQWLTYRMFLYEQFRSLYARFRLIYPSSVYRYQPGLFWWFEGFISFLKMDFYAMFIMLTFGNLKESYDPFSFGFSSRFQANYDLIDGGNYLFSEDVCLNHIKESVLKASPMDLSSMLDLRSFLSIPRNNYNFLTDVSDGEPMDYSMDLLWHSWRTGLKTTSFSDKLQHLREYALRLTEKAVQKNARNSGYDPDSVNRLKAMFEFQNKHLLDLPLRCLTDSRGNSEALLSVQARKLVKLYERGYLRLWDTYYSNSSTEVKERVLSPLRTISMAELLSEFKNWEQNKLEMCGSSFGSHNICKGVVSKVVEEFNSILVDDTPSVIMDNFKALISDSYIMDTVPGEIKIAKFLTEATKSNDLRQLNLMRSEMASLMQINDPNVKRYIDTLINGYVSLCKNIDAESSMSEKFWRHDGYLLGEWMRWQGLPTSNDIITMFFRLHSFQ